MAETPNILAVMADDHGQWASNPYGNRSYLPTGCFSWDRSDATFLAVSSVKRS